jgi:serine/threonine-protein kinase RsbW
MADAQAPEIVSLTLPSRLELLVVLDRVVLAICERMEFDDDACSQLSMSVVEAGTNAVQHGHKRDASRDFSVRFLIHADRLEVEVRDSGKGFDATSVSHDATSPDHIMDMRGRGIFIMRACCDSVEFESGPAGTLCRLVKYRALPARRVADA